MKNVLLAKGEALWLDKEWGKGRDIKTDIHYWRPTKCQALFKVLEVLRWTYLLLLWSSHSSWGDRQPVSACVTWSQQSCVLGEGQRGVSLNKDLSAGRDDLTCPRRGRATQTEANTVSESLGGEDTRLGWSEHGDEARQVSLGPSAGKDSEGFPWVCCTIQLRFLMGSPLCREETAEGQKWETGLCKRQF